MGYTRTDGRTHAGRTKTIFLVNGFKNPALRAGHDAPSLILDIADSLLLPSKDACVRNFAAQKTRHNAHSANLLPLRNLKVRREVICKRQLSCTGKTM